MLWLNNVSAQDWRVQVREESLAAHEQRLAELRALVAQIAADVGLPPDGLLAAEVATLGHKLEDVRESLATLADSADTRLSCGEDLLQAKAFLDTVHKVGRIFYFLLLKNNIYIVIAMVSIY